MSAATITTATEPTESESSRVAPTVRGPQASFADRFGTWTSGVPYPLLFVAGAASGILFACVILLFSHRNVSAAASPVAANVAQPVAMAAAWQPNVVTIRPADPMFDPPPFIAEPTPLAPAKVTPVAVRSTAKKPVTRQAPRSQTRRGAR